MTKTKRRVPETITRSIYAAKAVLENSRPLSSKSTTLSEVFIWRRISAPSICFCSSGVSLLERRMSGMICRLKGR